MHYLSLDRAINWDFLLFVISGVITEKNSGCCKIGSIR